MDGSRVMFTVSQLKIMTAQHVLTEAGIESFVLNKQDSAYAGVFGDIELYVDESESSQAKIILEEAEVL